MADVEPILLVPGEVRQVEKKRDFTDTTTGEFRPGKGRKVDVLTYGGFLKVSVGEDFDETVIHEGQVILWKVKALPWTVKRDDRPDLTGTAYLYAGPVTAEELDVLNKAGAVVHPAKV